MVSILQSRKGQFSSVTVSFWYSEQMSSKICLELRGLPLTSFPLIHNLGVKQYSSQEMYMLYLRQSYSRSSTPSSPLIYTNPHSLFPLVSTICCSVSLLIRPREVAGAKRYCFSAGRILLDLLSAFCHFQPKLVSWSPACTNCSGESMPLPSQSLSEGVNLELKKLLIPSSMIQQMQSRSLGEQGGVGRARGGAGRKGGKGNKKRPPGGLNPRPLSQEPNALPTELDGLLTSSPPIRTISSSLPHFIYVQEGKPQVEEAQQGHSQLLGGGRAGGGRGRGAAGEADQRGGGGVLAPDKEQTHLGQQIQRISQRQPARVLREGRQVAAHQKGHHPRQRLLAAVEATGEGHRRSHRGQVQMISYNMSSSKSIERQELRRKNDYTVKMRMPNGADYQGEVFEGKPHGRGKMRYLNSERYEGDFFQGMKQGKGKYYYMKGELYIGDWFQNKKQGKGQYFYKNGTIYTGDFADNKKHGHGKIEQANGSYFQGEFAFNNRDKTGICYDAIKNKKLMLVYDNGRLVSQSEIVEDQEDLREGRTEKDPFQLATKKAAEIREILSEEVYNSGMYSSQNSLAYVSQFDNKYGTISTPKQSKRGSTKALLAQNYIDSALLSKKICDWSNSEVSTWLNQIGFGDCIEDFRDNAIEGDSLLVLQNEDLKELGVNALGDRRILQRQIQFLRMIFKSQCLKEPIAEFAKRQLTMQLVRDIQQRRQKEEKKEVREQAELLSSSSSSSSNDSKKKRIRKERISMQSKVSQYLESRGIKLTFLIPKDQIEIIQPIGKGGYGQVFLGRWLGQEVAVKKYLKKQGFRNRHIGHFIEQVQVINRLNHPCIVLYMGMCIYDNEYAMVTEFLSGGSLFDYLHKKKERLSQAQLVSICKDVSLGMAYLHEKNVLHCDLKSSNLLIDENWNVKLCDFGLSRITTKDKKKNKNIRVGTPHWMAPEILRGGKYECPSDIYSFGILLWQMLTGRIPYKDYSTAQIIGMVGNDQKHHISIPHHPNTRLLEIFMRCTERDPALRPSFKEVVREVEEVEKELELSRTEV